MCLFLDLQSSLEHDVYSRLSTLQEGLIPKKRAGADDDLHRINELIQVTLLLLVKIFRLTYRKNKHGGAIESFAVQWLKRDADFISRCGLCCKQ